MGARVPGEFGDDTTRYHDARSRKNYAGTSPLTKASGKRKAVLARYVRNRFLADACYLWAFCATNASPGARRSTTSTGPKTKPTTRRCASFPTAWWASLDGCLRSRSLYDEEKAWGHRTNTPATTATAAA